MFKFFTQTAEALNSLPIPSKRDLWCLPLGGVGEIGQNMMIYGHAGQYLMVDCGMGFEPVKGSSTQFERVVADASSLAPQLSRLQAIVITHGHEDHIGGLLTLWPKLQVPIYASAFAMAQIQRKFAESEQDLNPTFMTIEPLQALVIGAFNLQWIPVTHSIPQSHSLLISTELGAILHTADWKIDPQPLVDKPFSFAPFSQLKNLLAVVGDSTNALKPGKTPSESACYAGLLQCVQQQPNRVVVSCFSSNIARLITLARVAKASGRYFAFAGRALERMVSIAKQLNYWPAELNPISLNEIGYLPRHEVMLITTGSQGEPRSGLWRLARGQHPSCELDAEDTVIFSAIKIPDNIARIDQLIGALQRYQLTVIHAEDHPAWSLHVSGHPSQEDLIALYQQIKPPLLIPVHGEPEHLQAHADLVVRHRLAKEVLLGENGDLFRIKPFVKLERQKVKTGHLYIDD
ncbi:ribonuclease J [Thiomicrospira microaerophila]|uniref:ribonuclease J n=1 Tax=Thiomicrospira microaerophila TaxID=406020 RepID=UPI0005C8D74E|nr:ribonuclease J [Thiomicrospira microaerophila]